MTGSGRRRSGLLLLGALLTLLTTVGMGGNGLHRETADARRAGERLPFGGEGV